LLKGVLQLLGELGILALAAARSALPPAVITLKAALEGPRNDTKGRLCEIFLPHPVGERNNCRNHLGFRAFRFLVVSVLSVGVPLSRVVSARRSAGATPAKSRAASTAPSAQGNRVRGTGSGKA
jgi:hypothetical protein